MRTRSNPSLSSLAHGTTIETLEVAAASDGRVMRRQRNIASVRAAVLDILADGESPTLATIAERAGVATRSVYRYFGDVDTAIADAVASRRARASEVFESEPAFGVNTSLEERLAMLVLRRLRLDRLAAPLLARGGIDDLLAALDIEVREAFAPELDRASDEQLTLLLCCIFRLQSVRAMREVFDDVDQDVASAMMRTATALLGGALLAS